MKLSDEMLKELRFAAYAQNVQTHGSTIRALLDDLDEAKARIAELEAGKECPLHGEHGGEAEELRAGIEKIIAMGDWDVSDELQALLDEVDARDSCAVLDRVANLEKALAEARAELTKLKNEAADGWCSGMDVG